MLFEWLSELSYPYVTMSIHSSFHTSLLLRSIILLVIIDKKKLNYNKFYNLPNLKVYNLGWNILQSFINPLMAFKAQTVQIQFI